MRLMTELKQSQIFGNQDSLQEFQTFAKDSKNTEPEIYQ